MTVNEITTLETWKILQSEPNSFLVDVRTNAEFDFTGIADLSKLSKQTILLPWMQYPDMKITADFNKKLEEILQKRAPNHNKPETHLLFICRSGGRSMQAANLAAKLGYQCYNVAKGFEGDLNSEGQRGQINGWKASNLPWRQS